MYYPGTKAAALLTINSAYVGETNEHFLCQLNASALMLDAKFKSYISSRASILVWDITGAVIRPSKIFVDLTANTLFVYFDAAVSTTVSRQYAICVSPGFSETDSTSAFTNCGFTDFYGFDEVAGSTVNDYSGATNLSVVSPATINADGQFHRAGTSAATGYFSANSNVLSAATKFTVFSNVYPTGGMTAVQVMFTNRNDADAFVQSYIASNTLVINIGNTITGTLTGVNFSNNTWNSIVIKYDGAGVTNADRLILYTNNVKRTLSFVGNIPTSVATFTDGRIRFSWPANGFLGRVDNTGILAGVAQSEALINTRYNSMFNAANFYTLASPIYAPLIGSVPSLNTGLLIGI